jgi:hypothetical protein
MNPLDDDITLDHMDPLGDNAETNLVTACQRCNSRKGDRHAKQFMAQKAREIQNEIAGVNLSTALTPNWMPPLLERKPTRPTLDWLLVTTEDEFNLPLGTISSRNGKQSIVSARRSFAKKARAHKYSLSEIGNKIGRHHTSVLHLVSTDGIVKISDSEIYDKLGLIKKNDDFHSIPQAQQQQAYKL